MTLNELKLATLKLIEEIDEDADDLTADGDIAAKMNDCINMVITELSRYKKIPARTTMEVHEDDEMDITKLPSFYQLNLIRGVAFDKVEDTVIFTEDGVAKIYYYKKPEMITEDTSDDHEFELSDDVMNIAPIGVAALILIADPANSYGTYYQSRYQGLLQTLDSRLSMPGVYIGDGLDV